ncbi:MAG: O-antigen ligase family protein [Nitrospiraceae bacterium]|nr:O-antigen ligase family protein [Nitrospiraceae bacterium]MDA8089610.1 O-antigen ligase family protein [Nitrospiraceae bacterium]
MGRFHSYDRFHPYDRAGRGLGLTGSGLVIIAAVSALLFGSVEYWAAALAGAMVVILFITNLFTPWLKAGMHREVFYAAAALTAYPLFQILPLPAFVLSVLQPRTVYLSVLDPSVAPAFHGITLYAFPTETALARLIIYLMIFFMAALLPEQGGAVYAVLKALSGFGFILALFGIIQHVAGNGKLYWLRPLSHGGNPFGPFVDRDHFAGYINMLIPLSLAVSLASRKIEKKMLFAFFSLIMTFSVFLTLSRGGVMAFISGLAVFSILVVPRSKRNGSKWQSVILITFAMSLASFVLYAGVSPLVERFSADGISDGQRILAWKGTLAAFRDFPIFGTGLGTFRYVFTFYQPPGLHHYWSHAHNDYLELLLEEGAAGFLTGAVFIFTVLRQVFKRAWEGKQAYLQAGFASSLVTIGVHSLVDFNLHIPSNSILFFMVLGLAMAAGKKQRQRN